MRCIEEIGKVSKTLDDTQRLELLDTLNERIESIIRNRPTMSRSEAAEIARGEVKKNIAEAKLIAERNAIINIMRRNELKQAVKDFVTNTKNDSPADALKTIMVGSSHAGYSSRRSVDATSKALRSEFVGGLVNDLERTGYLELAQSGALDREIAKELWEMREGGSPGITRNKEALAVAKVIKQHQKEMIDRLNGAGAWLTEEPGYVIKQGHDSIKMTKAGYENWEQTIKPALDWERIGQTYDVSTEAKQSEFLRGVFDNLTIGREFKFNNSTRGNPLGFVFSGPGNIAKSISSERVIHFKDADAFWSYHSAFGNGRLLDNTFIAMQKAASEIALMDRFGTNPEYMLERVKKELANEYRGDNKKTDALTGHEKADTLQWYMDELTGKARQVGNVSFAQLSSNIRAWQSISKLGTATIASFADVAAQAAELKYHGIGYLEGYGNALRGLSVGRGEGEYKEMMRLIGVGMDGMKGEIFARMNGAQEGFSGGMARAMELFFKANGLTWWTDVHKTSVTHILSTNLASYADKPHAKLSSELSNVLQQYGIKEAEWELVRNHAVGEIEGNKFIFVDKIKNIPDEQIKATIAAQRGIETDKVPAGMVTRYRSDLETSLRTYFVDSADWAIPSPGARENAMMTMGTHRGTLLGEALRFIMQFKAFPLTYLTKVAERELQGRVDFKSRIAPIMHTILATTVFGYLSTAAKDLAKGKTPQDAFGEDAGKVWLRAMLQGGGLGIYGDLLFAENTKYGNSALVNQLGPTFGSADSLFKLMWTARDAAFGKDDADWGDVAEAGFKISKDHTPFYNLFYLRLALDYSFAWTVQEALNPGSLGRLERKAADDGQTYWLKPTEALFQ